MNLSDLTKRVRKHLAEAGTSVYDDAAITKQLSDSARDLARQFALFKDVATLTVSARHFIPPADFGGMAAPPRANRIELRAGNPATLRAWDPDAYAAGSQVGMPSHYYWGSEYALGAPGDVFLWPAPGSAVRLDLTYIRVPPVMDDDADVPWFGAYPEYHDLIALHAAHQLGAWQGSVSAREPAWVGRLQLRLEEFRSVLANERTDDEVQLSGMPRRWRGW